jgi:hypothetical protein
MAKPYLALRRNATGRKSPTIGQAHAHRGIQAAAWQAKAKKRRAGQKNHDGKVSDPSRRGYAKVEPFEL